MKTFYIITFLLLAADMGALAQGQSNSLWKIGLSWSRDQHVLEETFVFRPGEVGGHLITPDVINYTTTLDVAYRLNLNLSITTGIGFTDRSLRMLFVCPDCDLFFTPGPFKKKIHFIEVPIGVRYAQKIGVVSFFVGGGITQQFQANRDLGFIEANDFNLSGDLGLGVAVEVLPGYQFQVDMEYSHGLIEAIPGTNYYLQTLSYGVGFAMML